MMNDDGPKLPLPMGYRLMEVTDDEANMLKGLRKTSEYRFENGDKFVDKTTCDMATKIKREMELVTKSCIDRVGNEHAGVKLEIKGGLHEYQGNMPQYTINPEPKLDEDVVEVIALMNTEGLVNFYNISAAVKLPGIWKRVRVRFT